MEEILNRIQHDEKLNLQITVFQDGESFSSIPPHSFDLALLDIHAIIIFYLDFLASMHFFGIYYLKSK